MSTVMHIVDDQSRSNGITTVSVSSLSDEQTLWRSMLIADQLLISR